MRSSVFGILVSIQKISWAPGSLCPDFRAFKVSCVQTIVRSKLPMIRQSYLQSYLCPYHCACIRISRPCNFERCRIRKIWFSTSRAAVVPLRWDNVHCSLFIFPALVPQGFSEWCIDIICQNTLWYYFLEKGAEKIFLRYSLKWAATWRWQIDWLIAS